MSSRHLVRVLVALAGAAILSCDRPTPVAPTPEPISATTTPPAPVPEPEPTPPPAVAPSIACPSNLVQETDRVPVAISYAPPVVTGGADPVSTTCSVPPGAPLGEGLTSITCTATDAQARSATCAFTATVSVIRRLAGTKFLAFGDSLTEGEVALPRTSLLALIPDQSYPSVLALLLKSRYFKQTITMINAGLGGERAGCSPGPSASCPSEDRLQGLISANRPDALLLMEGTNDLNSPPVSVNTVIQSLRADVIRARQAGIKVYLATLPPFSPCGAGAICRVAGNPADVVDLNERIRQLAAAQQAVLVDVHAALVAQLDLLMGDDGLHPTQAGYRVMAETFFEAIKNTFELP